MKRVTDPLPAIDDLGFAKVDLDRARRQGIGEIVLGAGKTAEHVAQIVDSLVRAMGFALVTRASPEQWEAVHSRHPAAQWHETARVIQVGHNRAFAQLPPYVAVVCAGTGDLPVAEEAAVVCEALGQPVRRVHDVGIAGIHRLLAQEDLLREARVLIVVAGMEGALPSAVAGLVDRPVIAVPTSIGYGANFGGLAALLGMLNSCGSGVTVVNIDNGFGAAYAAVQIARLAAGCAATAESQK
jgi:pyridinium-3,5-biscarboxylic acid mononucleotide synthase